MAQFVLKGETNQLSIIWWRNRCVSVGIHPELTVSMYCKVGAYGSLFRQNKICHRFGLYFGEGMRTAIGLTARLFLTAGLSKVRIPTEIQSYILETNQKQIE